MQEQSANIILGLTGPGDKFTLRYGLLKFNLSIRPLNAKQLIRISKEISHIKDLSYDKNMFPALMDSVDDTIYLARAIAIATGTRWRGLVTRAVMRLPLEDIKTLFKILHKQCDPEPFFFTIILATGRLNILKPPEQ